MNPSEPRNPGPQPTGPRAASTATEAAVARRTVEILNPYGFHLRPAEKFVGVAHRFQSEIRVSFRGKESNGKSILDLMTLAAECGTRLEVEARGPDAEAAVAALAELAAARFGQVDEQPPARARDAAS